MRAKYPKKHFYGIKKCAFGTGRDDFFMDFSQSKTKENLMRAFAGESQARNRYTFASSFAKKHGLYAVSEVFLFTANQEKEHAKIFYDLLKPVTGENINIEGGYPVEVFDNMLDILNAAHHDEYSEYETVYREFASVAQKEGFAAAESAFASIAKIEKIHGDRFAELLRMIKEDRLFKSDKETAWFCLNCGHVHFGAEAPGMCPVCKHERGYYIRESIVPYTDAKIIIG